MNWTVLIVSLVTVAVSASILYFDHKNVTRRTDRIMGVVSAMVSAAFLILAIIAVFI
jgi:hypothetical protein